MICGWSHVICGWSHVIYGWSHVRGGALKEVVECPGVHCNSRLNLSPLTESRSAPGLRYLLRHW